MSKIHLHETCPECLRLKYSCRRKYCAGVRVKLCKSCVQLFVGLYEFAKQKETANAQAAS